MSTFRIKMQTIPLKFHSFEIYLINALLSLLIKKRQLRTTRLVLFLNESLSGKREQINFETKRFLKEAFASAA